MFIGHARAYLYPQHYQHYVTTQLILLYTEKYVCQWNLWQMHRSQSIDGWLTSVVFL